VIDDITEVVYVQRVNIWRDIATRMAHEIKNPLTPIKLNAERIYKKVEILVMKNSRVSYQKGCLQ